MRVCAQDAAHGECFGRAKVEVFEDGARFAVHERAVARVTEIRLLLGWFEELKGLVQTN